MVSSTSTHGSGNLKSSSPAPPYKSPSNSPPSETARIHYEALRRYLSSQPNQNLTQRSSAKEKLTRLTRNQFHELSVDVYDELMRRQNDADKIPFLPVRDDFHPKRNQARQKLATLPKTRFRDLAGDVFFELERRHPELKTMFKEPEYTRAPPPPPPPPPDENKPALNTTPSPTPQPSQASNIVPVKGTINVETVDVPYTIPSTPSTPGLQDKRPSPREPSSNYNNYPTSSSLPSPSHYQPPPAKKHINADKPGSKNGANIQSLDHLMEDLGNMIKREEFCASQPGQPPLPASEKSEYSRKSERTTASSNTASSFGGYEHMNPSDFERIRADYELRISAMRKRIGQLENRMAQEKMGGKADHSRLQQLETLLTQQKQSYQQQTATLNKLQAEFDKLQEEYNAQLEVANDIRQEVTALLEELKELSNRNDELMGEKQINEDNVRMLTREMKELKSKYDQVKAELRSLRPTDSMMRESPKTDIVASNNIKPSPNGIITRSRIISYQLAVDGLLRAGRSNTPTSVLMAMKSLVIACKNISEDIEAQEEHLSPAVDPERVQEFKTKLSNSLSNLMVSARNHATGGGLFPVCLLDAAAEHLTIALVELIKLVKLADSMEEEVEEEEGEGMERKPKDRSFMSSSPTNSQSSIASPHTPNNQLPAENGVWNSVGLKSKQSDTSLGGGYGEDEHFGKDPEATKEYIEGQTDSIVHAIQTMLSALRAANSGAEIMSKVEPVLHIVNNITNAARSHFYKYDGDLSQAERVLRDLEESRDKLVSLARPLSRNVGGMDPAGERAAKQHVASAAFDVAKCTRELIGLF
ncbi:uncharacterized protein VTP21DRAFT_9381 [Calcarisporiella thermophila]|uniref:uncharacterized protein n=1 Tax=Calcarisporiella thermophila TaxID=911321 RepID=UPI00374411C4